MALMGNKTRLTTLEGQGMWGDSFRGSTIVECNVQDPNDVQQVFETQLKVQQVEAVISCLAAPSGFETDVWSIDYESSLNCLHAAQAIQARHYILLSAFCCRQPRLHFQRSKLHM